MICYHDFPIYFSLAISFIRSFLIYYYYFKIKVSEFLRKISVTKLNYFFVLFSINPIKICFILFESNFIFMIAKSNGLFDIYLKSKIYYSNHQKKFISI